MVVCCGIRSYIRGDFLRCPGWILDTGLGEPTMNDFQKAMFIFFDEWGGLSEFQAEHEELYFHGVDIDEIIKESGCGYCGADLELFNQLFDLGWQLTEDGDAFVSRRWGSC